MLRGEEEPRFLISAGLEAGAADRLTGIFSEFYMALLTRRAFLISTFSDVPGWDSVFDAPFINWTSADLDMDMMAPLRIPRHLQGARQFGPSVNVSQYSFLYLVNNDTLNDQIFGSENLQDSALVPGSKFLLVASNRGRSIKLFDNPHHRDQLLEWGLTSHTAATCAYRFLFREQQHVLDTFQQDLDLLKNKSVLKIGIQIRAGDNTFSEDTGYPTALIQSYFDCAQQLDQQLQLTNPARPIVWYVVSESLQVCNAVKQQLGSKVFTRLDLHAEHANCKETGGCSDVPGRALQQAVGQMLAFSLTDFQVHR
ncbi:TPA: hypothetical protein ACH3X3_004902 [Trebouxia sp. C0006]